MNEPFQPYQALVARAKEIALAGSAASLLSWDQETFMPPKALAYRAEQLAFLGGWTHRMFTAPEVGDWIKASEDHGFSSDSVEGVNVREWRRQYDRKTRVSDKLVEAFERAKTLAREAWVRARAQSKFNLFQSHFETLLDFNRRLAECWGYEDSPYDALLEEYEPDARSADLRALFDELKPAQVAILGPALERSAMVPADRLQGHYPVVAQQAFNREVASAFGFDFDAGRVDTTTHPFCTGLGPDDCRITTRYDESDFTQSLYGVLHEVGHGLYDQGLPKDHFGSPMGSAISLGIHESQSRLWENHVGRHASFWEHWHAAACRHFPSLARWTPQDVHESVNRVELSFIRVEADQVTYDLHILLRFDIELALIERRMAAQDVPAAWNQMFESMFGLKVPDDARGCLQDIHWSLGSFGYFPTYTLGNLNAAQLFRRALKDTPALETELARGQYGSLLAWLRGKIHAQGSRLLPPDLMRFATGEPTRAAYHLDHLRHCGGALKARQSLQIANPR